MVRGRPVAVLVAVAAVTGAGVLALRDPASGPAGHRLTADNPGAGADPAVTEVGAPPCPVALPGATPVATLFGATARCLGSAQPLDVAAAVAGRATLLNLWASWCAPCREEMPVLGQVPRHGGRGTRHRCQRARPPVVGRGAGAKSQYQISLVHRRRCGGGRVGSTAAAASELPCRYRRGPCAAFR